MDKDVLSIFWAPTSLPFAGPRLLSGQWTRTCHDPLHCCHARYDRNSEVQVCPLHSGCSSLYCSSRDSGSKQWTDESKGSNYKQSLELGLSYVLWRNIFVYTRKHCRNKLDCYSDTIKCVLLFLLCMIECNHLLTKGFSNNGIVRMGDL